ncbi:MAG: hypothetical protein ABI867_25055 [Kofleriaceae bacterium]
MSDDAAVAAPSKVDAYRCPRCGADTTFKPGADALVCVHCGNVEPITARDEHIVEHDFQAALADRDHRSVSELAPNGREVVCKNCGARTVTTRHADRCPFCDAALVVEVESSPTTIVPESVLPFAITTEDAAEKFRAWLQSRWFKPFGLLKRAKRDGMDGVYLPYWTYDSATTTRYRGERGEHYYVTEHYTDSQGKSQTRQVQHTRWYSASGVVDVPFDDVLVCGTTSLPMKIIDSLEPWGLEELKPFDGKYLAGFTAECARVPLADGFTVAEAKMDPAIRSTIRRDIGGDEQRIHSMAVRHANVTFKHVLLPLWISCFRDGDQVFRVTVNARTGEVAGERPWSTGKIVLLILFACAIIAVILYFRQR